MDGVRLTTMEWTYPRIVLAEVDTHRMLSRNSASSRAIPREKIIEQVMTNPFIPDVFPINGKGMQPGGYVSKKDDPERYDRMLYKWLKSRDDAVANAEDMMEDGMHKQIVNRILEAYQWTTTVITATDWNNMWAQRVHPDAQREFQIIATIAYREYMKSTPKYLQAGLWHTPYIDWDDTAAAQSYALNNGVDYQSLINQMSASRAAAVSYHRQGDKREVAPLLSVFERLTGGASQKERPGHWSPLEHVARPLTDTDSYMVERKPNGMGGITYYDTPALGRSGNFQGYYQMRKQYSTENWVDTPEWVNSLSDTFTYEEIHA